MSIPASLQGIFQNLPVNTQALVWRDYESRKKSGLIAYILWLLFGFHYIYLGRIGLQLIYWLTFGGFGFWAIIDLFRMPGMVGRKNEAILLEAIARYPAMGMR